MRSWKATAFPPPRRILLPIHCPSPPCPPCGVPKLRVWGPCSMMPLLTPPWPGQAPSSVLPSCPGTAVTAPTLVYIRVPSSPLLDAEPPEGGHIHLCRRRTQYSTCSAKACLMNESVRASAFQDCHLHPTHPTPSTPPLCHLCLVSSQNM